MGACPDMTTQQTYFLVVVTVTGKDYVDVSHRIPCHYIGFNLPS